MKLWRTPSEPCLLARRRRLQPYSAYGAVWVSILTTSCLISSLSDRFCKEKLRMSRFAKRGNTIQLRLAVRLCLFRGRRMGDILRMAFTQNRVRSLLARVFLSLCAFLVAVLLLLYACLNLLRISLSRVPLKRSTI